MIFFEKLRHVLSEHLFYHKEPRSNIRKDQSLLGAWPHILFTIAVFFSSGPVLAMDVSLEWDSHPSAKGYKIYYKAGSSGPPYDGTGAAEGDSPIDVGWVSEFTLRALSDDKVYYIALTAYKNNMESGYSSEVSTARSASANSGAVGGGGGSSGCFISTIAER